MHIVHLYVFEIYFWTYHFETSFSFIRCLLCALSYNCLFMQPFYGKLFNCNWTESGNCLHILFVFHQQLKWELEFFIVSCENVEIVPTTLNLVTNESRYQRNSCAHWKLSSDYRFVSFKRFPVTCIVPELKLSPRISLQCENSVSRKKNVANANERTNERMKIKATNRKGN